MRIVRNLMVVLALAVMTNALGAETYRFYCNHCDTHIEKDGTGKAVCCECSKLNVLTACRECGAKFMSNEESDYCWSCK